VSVSTISDEYCRKEVGKGLFHKGVFNIVVYLVSYF